MNRSAWAAGVLRSARSPDYRLTVTNGSTSKVFTVAELAALPQATHQLADRVRGGVERRGRVDGCGVG